MFGFKRLPVSLGLTSTLRCRQALIGCLLALGVSTGAAGTLLLVRWQAERAAGADVQMMLGQASRQILESVESRRRTVDMLQDALDRAPELGEEEREALAKSAAEHTPQLIGNGWVDRKNAFHWWVAPSGLTSQELEELSRQVVGRVWMRDLFGVSSAFTLHAGAAERPLLVAMKPLRARAGRGTRIIALFELKPLLEEALKSLPAEMKEGDRLLYRSGRWKENGAGADRVDQRVMRFNENRWLLRIQRPVIALLPMAWVRFFLILTAALALSALMGILWVTERMRHLAVTDALTGLSNRRFFFEQWEGEVERAKRYKRPLSCLMVDLNGFKRVNDLLGHAAGDRLLRQAAGEIQSRLRKSDLLARYGGDEFVIALPETNLRQAFAAAQKLREIAIPAPFVHPVRLSVGIGQLQEGDSPQEVIQRADADLYSSRHVSGAGRGSREEPEVISLAQ